MRLPFSLLIGLSLLAAALAAPLPQDDSNDKPKEDGSSKTESEQEAPATSRLVRQADDNGRNFTDLQPGEVRPMQSKVSAPNAAEEAPEETSGGGLVVVDPNATHGRVKRQEPHEKDNNEENTPVQEHSETEQRNKRQVNPDDVIEAGNTTVVWPQAPLTSTTPAIEPKQINKRQATGSEEEKAAPAPEAPESESSAPVEEAKPAKRQATDGEEEKAAPAPETPKSESSAPVEEAKPVKRQADKNEEAEPASGSGAEASVEAAKPENGEEESKQTKRHAQEAEKGTAPEAPLPAPTDAGKPAEESEALPSRARRYAQDSDKEALPPPELPAPAEPEHPAEKEVSKREAQEAESDTGKSSQGAPEVEQESADPAKRQTDDTKDEAKPASGEHPSPVNEEETN